jgi:hypothetical protein
MLSKTWSSYGSREVEVADDVLCIHFCIVRLAVQHETLRSRNRTDLVPSHEGANALLGSHLFPCDPGSVGDALDYVCGRALQKYREQLSAAPPNNRVKLFEKFSMAKSRPIFPSNRS